MPDHATNRAPPGDARRLPYAAERRVHAPPFWLLEGIVAPWGCARSRAPLGSARGRFSISAVKFELAERRMVERVGREAIAVDDGANLFEPAFGAFVLRDCDCTVQRNDPGKDVSSSMSCKVKRSFPSQCPQCDGPSRGPMRSRPLRDIGSAGNPLPRGRGTFALRPQAVNPIGIDPGRRARSGCPMPRRALASAPRAGT